MEIWQMLLQVIMLALGFFMLVKGSDWFVDGSSAIARRFKIPQLVIGLTIVAMGTSAPEAAVSITAALRGNAGITIGNIVGSNILNILIILGICALITPLTVAKSILKIEIPFMLAITSLLLVTGLDGTVYWWEGMILLLCFIGYLTYLFIVAKKDKDKEPEGEIKSMSAPKALLFTALGLAFIVWGSDLTVDSATAIAKALGWSERFIGLTIVALGTSLPELFTSVSATRKGNADIAIGNIVGSNIFNILFIVGISSVIIPVTFLKPFIFDTIVAFVAGIILWACPVKSYKLKWWAGIVMLVSYAIYFAVIL